VSPVWFLLRYKGVEPRNRMSELFTYGTVGRAPGNRCLYPERLNTTPLGSTTIEDLIVFSKRITNLIVLLCESLSSNTTWNLCFNQFWSFEKTSLNFTPWPDLSAFYLKIFFLRSIIFMEF
jgi:hypothetical protein